MKMYFLNLTTSRSEIVSIYHQYVAVKFIPIEYAKVLANSKTRFYYWVVLGHTLNMKSRITGLRNQEFWVNSSINKLLIFSINLKLICVPVIVDNHITSLFRVENLKMA